MVVFDYAAFDGCVCGVAEGEFVLVGVVWFVLVWHGMGLWGLWDLRFLGANGGVWDWGRFVWLVGRGILTRESFFFLPRGVPHEICNGNKQADWFFRVIPLVIPFLFFLAVFFCIGSNT